MAKVSAQFAIAALLASAGIANAQVILGLENVAEQIRTYDVGTGTYADFIPTGIEVTSMTADDANRRIFYSDRSSLWSVSYDPPRTPVLIGTFAGDDTQLFGGLAWVPSENKLYGTNSNELFEVDTSTAALTLIRTITGADFGGLDFNAADGKLYASQDGTSTTAPFAGRGIYTIDPPFASGAITFITGYPTTPTAQTDIDGLAVGGGNVYLARDLNDNTLYIYNISAGTYSGPFTRPGGTATSRIVCGAAYAPSLNTVLPGVNLSLSITDPADCSVAVNTPAQYTIAVQNIGFDPATNVSVAITIPAGATNVSSVPSGTLVGNTLTVSLGGIAGSGGQSAITLTLTPTSGPTLDLSATVSATEPDTNNFNNTASSSSVLVPMLPATANIRGLVSNYAPSASSNVPGQPGVKFSDAVTPGKPVVSADGRNWLQLWDTDDADTTADQVLLRSINGVQSVAVEEGVTVLPSGFTPEATFASGYGINNTGQFVFAGVDTNPTTTADGYIVKWDGSAFVNVAIEGSPAPAVTGGTNWSTTKNASTIANDGTTAFLHSIAGLTTTTDTFILRNDGNAVVAQEGVGSPAGQMGTPGLYQGFDSAGPGTGVYFSADHTSYISSGDTSAATTEDRYVDVNGTVRIQEGYPIAGSSFTSLVSAVNAVTISPNGANWMAIGSNADTQDWVVRNGTVVAQTDAPIFVGASETYDDAIFASCFFMHAANSRGDYVVGGTTNAANDRANAVLVLNNRTVIARENDPIDLDNNGMFDDGVFLSIFIDHRLAMTNDAVYVTVRLRDVNAALCNATITDIGQALVRIPLPPSCPADFNGVGGLTVQDIFDFLAAYFNNDPSADFNGMGGITVQDIFDYLAAYFNGCP